MSQTANPPDIIATQTVFGPERARRLKHAFDLILNFQTRRAARLAQAEAESRRVWPPPPIQTDEDEADSETG